MGGHASRHADRQALVGVLVDHAQQLQRAAVMCLLGHEVISPDVVGALRTEADTRSVIQPQATSLWLPLGHFQPLGAPDALHALAVHRPAGHLQQVGDALVAVAAEAGGQSDDRRGEGVLVVSDLWLVALGGAVLAQSPAGSALGDVQPLTDCLDACAPPRGAQKFPRAASWRMSLSRVRSETAWRNLAFSRSSSFMRLA